MIAFGYETPTISTPQFMFDFSYLLWLQVKITRTLAYCTCIPCALIPDLSLELVYINARLLIQPFLI
jgi:hypothetical protein